ncbi:MAG: 3-oxoacyl-[acyl-carrier protein] reductase [Candidatus Saccharibacteria bacterium]|nr:3-oxoacyl-[acyl-carrier protein] reductase [Candidatus Saccharibacteria bacterium]
MPAENRTLKETVIAITGASSGIGRETARQLVAAGAKVALGARRLDRLEELVLELGTENAIAVQMDVTSPADNKELVAKALSAFGRLDSIVANAGIGHYGGISDNSDEDLMNMINVNFAGTVWTVRAALPEFRKSHGGDIVIISSVAGLRGGADEAVYAGTKFAQIGLAGSIDRELSPEGIRVTAICPAGTKTEFAIGTGRTEGDAALDDYMNPSDVAFQIVTALQQPRRLRTGLWTTWSMAQTS